MIIFYNKKTGKIVGTIDGRVHSDAHLKMWIGDKKETDRIIVEWKKVDEQEIESEQIVLEEAGKDEKGEPLYKKVKKKVKERIPIFKPNHPQAGLFEDIVDKRKKKISDYKVKLKNGKVVGFTKKP
jgi:hypothetical protein